jgi:hypothetical protein
MSLTTFRSWIYGELVTVSMMNQQIRDNGNAIWVGTTAGDMDYYTGATGKARLPIGTAGQILKVNTGATAPEWGNSGLALIEKKLLTDVAANFDFISIPSTYSSLKLIIHARGNKNAVVTSMAMKFNNDTGNNYDYRIITNDSSNNLVANAIQATGSILAGNISALTATAGMAGSSEIIIPNYSGAIFRKNAIINSFYETGESGGVIYSAIIGGHWRNTLAINQITLTLDSGSFIAGSIASLYGMI